jgi:hypothetical protein
MLDCTVMEARERVHLERLDWKISRDGKKRAKLSAAMIGIFIEWLNSPDSTTRPCSTTTPSSHQAAVLAR